jgi:hypothetical protein
MVGIQFSLNLHLDTYTVKERLTKLDWIGTFIFAGSMSSLLIGVTSGGTSHPWGSVNIIAPIVVGVCGLVVFVFIEKLLAKVPVVPLEVFQNRTSTIALLVSFAMGFSSSIAIYYMIVYVSAFRLDQK